MHYKHIQEQSNKHPTLHNITNMLAIWTIGTDWKIALSFMSELAATMNIWNTEMWGCLWHTCPTSAASALISDIIVSPIVTVLSKSVTKTPTFPGNDTEVLVWCAKAKYCLQQWSHFMSHWIRISRSWNLARQQHSAEYVGHAAHLRIQSEMMSS